MAEFTSNTLFQYITRHQYGDARCRLVFHFLSYFSLGVVNTQELSVNEPVREVDVYNFPLLSIKTEVEDDN